ncbi:MAG: uridine kinase [Candidatus Tectomicrobia bacterium]|nr:uridine kinase [Candidatus Tectomicrobia bacterium]
MTTIDEAVAAIHAKRQEIPCHRSMLVGITGIDGCGKGYLTGRVVAQLQQQGLKAVGINVDGWLNLPYKRFNKDNPAEHFYEHAIRFDEMFQQLILPLKEHRKHSIVADFAEETATEYRKHTYRFEDVDIIVLEGIYLLKRAYRHDFDLTFWVDCTFETALERALQRGQEGLPPDETIRAYETIYFPAQQIHFTMDDPKSAADIILSNDSRIGGGTQVGDRVEDFICMPAWKRNQGSDFPRSI